MIDDVLLMAEGGSYGKKVNFSVTLQRKRQNEDGNHSTPVLTDLRCPVYAGRWRVEFWNTA